MATLNFTKEGDKYVAEATVNGDYALHVERKDDGYFVISQRSTATGQYKDCLGESSAGLVIDHAFGHGVYPSGGMHLRFESASEVTMAEINEGA